MSRLVGDRTAHKHATFVCNYCLRPCSSTEILERHVELCQRHPAEATDFPKPEQSVLKFKATRKQFYLPFYLVRDFDCFPMTIEETGDGDEPCTKKRKVERKVTAVDEHVVSGFACKRVSSVPEYETPIYVYSNPDPMTRFFERIMQESKIIGQLMSKNELMLPLTKEDRKNTWRRQCAHTVRTRSLQKIARFIITVTSVADICLLPVILAICS